MVILVKAHHPYSSDEIDSTKRKFVQQFLKGIGEAMSMMVTELAVRAASRREVRAAPTLLYYDRIIRELETPQLVSNVAK